MDSLLKEFKSAIDKAEENDTSIRVSIYGKRIELTSVFNFPQVEVTRDFVSITNHDNMDRFIVDGEYEIKKIEDDDGYSIYKIICKDGFADVEILS